MNHRERILAAIRHQPVDRLPTDMWATPEVREKLFVHFEVGKGRQAARSSAQDIDKVSLMGSHLSHSIQSILDLYGKLDIDGILNISPPYLGPAPRIEEDYWENEWGMGYRWQDYGAGVYQEQVHYPLAQAETIADLEAYHWPDPDWYDYNTLSEAAIPLSGRAICCGYTAVFYYHNLLRGLELSLMDPLLRPEFTHYLIERLSDFFTEYHRRCFEAGRGVIDITEVTDDFGSQHGLLISPKIFDEFYRRPIQRAINLAKSYGIIVFHHDDGDMRPLLPTLVKMGIEVLNPIQWRCGNWDLSALKRGFGDRICFHGGVDNQQTLPYGTPKDVRAEVKRLIEILGCDHTGFIIAPCHNLQPNTPVENIIALYEAACEHGMFT